MSSDFFSSKSVHSPKKIRCHRGPRTLQSSQLWILRPEPVLDVNFGLFGVEFVLGLDVDLDVLLVLLSLDVGGVVVDLDDLVLALPLLRQSPAVQIT